MALMTVDIANLYNSLYQDRNPDGSLELYLPYDTPAVIFEMLDFSCLIAISCQLVGLVRRPGSLDCDAEMTFDYASLAVGILLGVVIGMGFEALRERAEAGMRQWLGVPRPPLRKRPLLLGAIAVLALYAASVPFIIGASDPMLFGVYSLIMVLVGGGLSVLQLFKESLAKTPKAG